MSSIEVLERLFADMQKVEYKYTANIKMGDTVSPRLSLRAHNLPNVLEYYDAVNEVLWDHGLITGWGDAIVHTHTGEPESVLFVGTIDVGKTTLARYFKDSS